MCPLHLAARQLQRGLLGVVRHNHHVLFAEGARHLHRQVLAQRLSIAVQQTTANARKAFGKSLARVLHSDPQLAIVRSAQPIDLEPGAHIAEVAVQRSAPKPWPLRAHASFESASSPQTP